MTALVAAADVRDARRPTLGNGRDGSKASVVVSRESARYPAAHNPLALFAMGCGYSFCHAGRAGGLLVRAGGRS
jgi:hypothetical protein